MTMRHRISYNNDGRSFTVWIDSRHPAYGRAAKALPIRDAFEQQFTFTNARLETAHESSGAWRIDVVFSCGHVDKCYTRSDAVMAIVSYFTKLQIEGIDDDLQSATIH